jgi:hypothetical protein
MTLTFIKLLKTNVEKMSAFHLSIMLMKTNELNRSLHYVDEKKGDMRNYEFWIMKAAGVKSIPKSSDERRVMIDEILRCCLGWQRMGRGSDGETESAGQ